MRHPFRLFVIIVLTLGLVTMTVAAILLPQVVASRLTAKVQERYGLALAVDGAANLSLTDGLAVELHGVTLTDNTAQGVPLASIPTLVVASPLTSFTGGDDIRRVTLVDPVFTFSSAPVQREANVEVAEAAPRPKHSVTPLDLNIVNGSLKASDETHDLVIAVSDVSGQIALAADGTLQAGLRGMLNGVPTELTLAVDDTRRLREKGSPADVSLTSKAGQIMLSGRLGLASDLSFDGSASAESGDARNFLAWLGMPLKGLATASALGIDAGLSISKSKASFKNLAFALADMQARGVVDVQASGRRPTISADLTFNRLDLNIYHRPEKAGAAPAATPPDLSKDWSEKPLPFDDLKAVDGTIKITTDVFRAGAVETGASSLTATLGDGALQARVETTALFGGKGALDLTLSHGAPTQMKLALDVTGVAAKQFLGTAFGVTFLSGPADVKLNVTAKGDSPVQLVSTLAGTANVNFQAGTIDGIDLAARAGLLKKDDAEGWGTSSGEVTALTSASASATFADGIAALSTTRLEAAGLSVDITGNVDLLRRAVDLKATPGAGLPLPVAATVKGPWDKPKLSAKVDVENVLRDGDVPEDVEKLAKGAVKKAKKKLKKLFGN
jgi:uncharacterized protein involved in outer membrane biogenesis